MAAQYLTVSEGKIAYDDMGSGPLVVCMPGMGDMRDAFRFLAPKLASAGYRVVTVDPRGQGESSARWAEYSVEANGRDMLALIRHLDAGPAVLVGHSINAASAIWAAAEDPQRVRALVLLGPAVHGDLDRKMRPLMKLLTLRPWGPAAWIAYFKRLFPTRKPGDFAAYTTALKRNMAEPGHMNALYGMMIATRAGAEARIDRLHLPVLVIMGDKDADFPEPEAAARRLAEELRGHYHMIQGAGHYPHVEMPEVTIPLILDFVKALEAEAVHAPASGG